MDITYYKKYEPIFGSWHIVREIGEGSFGKVFELEREDFGRVYKSALKAITIPQSKSEIDSALDAGMDEVSVTNYFKGFVEELVTEFALMSELKGESNIVSYEDHAVIPHEDGIGWDILIRMELLTPMIKYAKEKPLGTGDVVRLGIDICKALELCKANNIVHRDIKPENIFVSRMGSFKLGDFGIAKTVEKTTGGMSKKGTYTYMAPEVYKGEEYGSSVDIYSLGIVLYRYLNNNRTPFLPEYPAPMNYRDIESALAKRLRGDEIPAPAKADKTLADIILKACAYNPKDRYASPTEMREALEALSAKSAAVIIAEQPAETDDDKTVGIFDSVKPAVTENPSEAVTVAEKPIVKKEAVVPAEKTDSEEAVEELNETIGVFGSSVQYNKLDKKTEPRQMVNPEPVCVPITEVPRKATPKAPDETVVLVPVSSPQDDDRAAGISFADKAPTEEEAPESKPAEAAQTEKTEGGNGKKIVIGIIIAAVLLLLATCIPIRSNDTYMSDGTVYTRSYNLFGKFIDDKVVDAEGYEANYFAVYDNTTKLKHATFYYNDKDIYYSIDGEFKYYVRDETSESGDWICVRYNENDQIIRVRFVDTDTIWYYHYNDNGEFTYRSYLVAPATYWSENSVTLGRWYTYPIITASLYENCTKLEFDHQFDENSAGNVNTSVFGTQYVYVQDASGYWSCVGSFSAPDANTVHVSIDLDGLDVHGVAVIPVNGYSTYSHEIHNIKLTISSTDYEVYGDFEGA